MVAVAVGGDEVERAVVAGSRWSGGFRERGEKCGGGAKCKEERNGARVL